MWLERRGGRRAASSAPGWGHREAAPEGHSLWEKAREMRIHQGQVGSGWSSPAWGASSPAAPPCSSLGWDRPQPSRELREAEPSPGAALCL